jgi:hypothetical protein
VHHNTDDGGVHKPTPGTSREAAGGAGTIGISGVQELTQNGNLPNDNLGTLDDVVTGRGPAWVSAIYKGPDFGPYGGFGLVLHLDGSHTLNQLVVDTSMLDWSAQVYVSGSYHGAVSGWGSPTSAGTRLYNSQTFSLDGRTGSWVLFWMLNPGASDQAMVRRLIVT